MHRLQHLDHHVGGAAVQVVDVEHHAVDRVLLVDSLVGARVVPLLNQPGQPFQILTHQRGHTEVSAVVVGGEPVAEELREHAARSDPSQLSLQLGDRRSVLLLVGDRGV